MKTTFITLCAVLLLSSALIFIQSTRFGYASQGQIERLEKINKQQSRKLDSLENVIYGMQYIINQKEDKTKATWRKENGL